MKYNELFYIFDENAISGAAKNFMFIKIEDKCI